MKNLKTIFVIILAFCLGTGFCFLLYKSWNIFGFWTLAWTGLLSIFSTSLLGNFVGSRVENNGVIMYNPKEWPKILNILVSVSIGYYLFTIINNSEVISNSDYTFGLAYLILLTAVPILISIFKLVRDRNDFISIDGDQLKYKDNDETGEFKFTDIANVELANGLKLTFKDDKTVTIKTSNMNFNAKDLSSVYLEIKAKLPEDKPSNSSL
jgi:hypothetical protein